MAFAYILETAPLRELNFGTQIARTRVHDMPRPRPSPIFLFLFGNRNVIVLTTLDERDVTKMC